MQQIKDFLEFNGHNMYFTLRDGVWWIALKPICEALNVDYIRQFKNIKVDEILGPALSKQTIQVPNDQGRSMVCLPEFYIYGWLFQIRSESKELVKYKWACYKILYEHFQGTITRRQQVLNDRFSHSQEKADLEKALSRNKDFVRLRELDKEIRGLNGQLRKMDDDLMSRQGEFNFS